jgi:hypothetical protein
MKFNSHELLSLFGGVFLGILMILFIKNVIAPSAWFQQLNIFYQVGIGILLGLVSIIISLIVSLSLYWVLS